MDNFPQIPGYKIKKKIGEGGMSIVYLAIQERLKRKVAVKVMHPHRMKDSQAARRFLKEAETAAKLNHSNIVSIIDFGEADNVYYLAMEYLPSSLASKGKLPPSEALNIAEQVADALDYAHSQGIIHRDIKSENILFRRNGTPVVVDFGIARTVNSTTRLTRTGISIGTIHYMSPEQCRAEVLDGRSDLYSLGIVLFEMLTGQLPFDAKNEAGVLLKHLQESIPSLPENLMALQPIIMNLLEKNRDKRIARGRDLVRMITNLRNGSIAEGNNINSDASMSMSTVEIPYIPPQPKRRRLIIGSILVAAIISVTLYITIPPLSQSKVPPILIPSQQETRPHLKKDSETPALKEEALMELEYNSLLNQAKSQIESGQFKLALKTLNHARKIRPGEEIAKLEETLAKKQKIDKQNTALKTSRMNREKGYKDNLHFARQKLTEDQFQSALEFVSKARNHRNTKELKLLENQIKKRQEEFEREAFLKNEPPQTVNIFAIPSGLQKKYNEILKRIEIPGPPPGTWVSGQASISLTIKATGEIKVIDLLDKWLTIKPEKSRDQIKESIVSRIRGIELTPPTSKNGAPVIVQGWRMSFKVETFQGKIILDLQ